MEVINVQEALLTAVQVQPDWVDIFTAPAPPEESTDWEMGEMADWHVTEEV